jgi:hypothetical protein
MGFALLDSDQRRQMASIGGKRAAQLGKGHKFTSEKAREAGLKSAEVRAAKRLYRLSSPFRQPDARSPT